MRSPVSYETALARLRGAAGVRRAGARIRARFDQAVSTLKRRGTIRVDRRKFLWVSSHRDSVVRVPDEGDPSTRRTVEDVAREEMKLAVQLLLGDALTAGRDELTVRTARLFGWTRRGPDIGKALNQAVTALVKDGSVVWDGDLLSITTDEPGD